MFSVNTLQHPCIERQASKGDTMSILSILFIVDIIAFVVYGFVKSRMRLKILQGASLTALILYLVIILFITVFSRHPVLEVRWNIIPLQDFDFGLFYGQLLPNILLFIPGGILLDGALPKCNLIFLILIGIGISLCIEFIQLFVHVGICDIDDLITNSLGFIFGVFPARIMIRFPMYEKITV